MAKMIRIVKTPSGEAPEDVRAAWVGLTLPMSFIDDAQTGNKELGIQSQEFLPERDVAVVSQCEAIAILEKANQKAADWFKQFGIPKEDRFFTFGLDEIEVL